MKRQVSPALRQVPTIVVMEPLDVVIVMEPLSVTLS